MTIMTFRFKSSFLSASALVFVLILTLLQPSARASAPFLSNDEVLTQTGKSIAEWGAEWWQWAFENPEVLADRTGKSGPLGDAGGSVFFAEGSGGHPANVQYTVSCGKYVLLPVMTYIWTFFEP